MGLALIKGHCRHTPCDATICTRKECLDITSCMSMLTRGIHWRSCLRCHAVSVQVLVSMSKELPVVVKYQMGDIGHIR